MSPKQLIPVSFASLMGQIIICTLLLQTSSKYPPYPASLADNPTLIAGCALIISCGLLQVGFLASGINLPHNRILFESTHYAPHRLPLQRSCVFVARMVRIEPVGKLIHPVHLGLPVHLPHPQRHRRTGPSSILSRPLPQVYYRMIFTRTSNA